MMTIALALAACGDQEETSTFEVVRKEPAKPAAKPVEKPRVAAAPKPPSTGEQMPEPQVPSGDRAKAEVAGAVERAKQADPPWATIADVLSNALPVAFPDATKDAIPGVAVWFEASTKARRWRAVVAAGQWLLELGVDNPKVASGIVRALAEMGEYKKAITVADALAKQNPKARSLLMTAMTFVFCKAEAWPRCVATGDAVLAELARMKVPATDESVVLARLLRDLGWIVTGKPKQALADIAKVEQKHGPMPQFAQAKHAAEQAVERGYYLEVVPLEQVPLGVYHLMGRADTGALVTLKLNEHAGKPRAFRVDVEIPGVTERSSNTLALAAGKHLLTWANPPIKVDLDTTKIRSTRPSQLHIKIVELAKTGERIVVDETLPIQVLPRDYLPLKRKLGADALVPTFGFVGAWLTSNDKSVDEFLAKAKQRAPDRNFVGEQDATVPQVKALFDELKHRGVSYVMDPDVTAERAFVQRTRLPADVLASTNAQCLESTLLFATLLEAIGIRPLVVFVPGHAFVGWHTIEKDGTSGEPLFLETTMIGGARFEDAVKVATRRVASERKRGSFESGASTIVDVAEIRAQGFTAQPY